MFLLSPEADMRPGDLQAQVPWTNAVWFADREARQRLTKGFLANKGRSVLRLGALVAHGLLWNHKETEVSHSPTVSQLIQPHCCSCRLSAGFWIADDLSRTVPDD